MVWNDRDRLYTVTLGHGHPEQGPFVSVTTVHKTPEHRISDAVSSGPTGYQDAWLYATLLLGEQAFPDDRRAATAVLHAADDPNYIDDADRPEDLGPEWTPCTVVIDGKEHEAALRVAGDAWAYLIDLEHVAIAVNGLSDPAPAGLALSDQTHCLDRYQ